MANAPTTPIVLTNEQFGTLRDRWAASADNSLHLVVRVLCRFTGLSYQEVVRQVESKILYGHVEEGDEKECLVGWLHALVPGIVLFLGSTPDDPYNPAGLLMRSRGRSRGIILFSVWTFLPTSTISIWDSNRLAGYGFTTYPAFFQGDTGTGLTLPIVGFTPHRWEALQLWLARWLPETDPT